MHPSASEHYSDMTQFGGVLCYVNSIGIKSAYHKKSSAWQYLI